MSTKQYTDRDIQDFLDGKFSGDQNDFMLFIEQNADAMKQLEFYKLLFSLISQQVKQAELPMDFAESIVTAIQVKKRAKEERVLNVSLVMAMCIGAAIWCIYFRNILFFYLNNFFGLTAFLVVVLLAWLFTKIEIDAKRRIYS